jgi:hypothetical protein
MEQVTSSERVVLDTRVLHPFEIGARLEALLCYSTWSAERREKIADAICARLFAFTIAQDPTLKRELSRKYPRYAKHNRTKLDSLDARREKALRIGVAFLPMLKEPAIGELPEFRGEKRRLTLQEIVRFIWPERQGGPDFVYEDWLKDREKDVRAHRPTAHLAAAYQWIARERSGNTPSGTFDYQDIDLHREAVRRANEFAGYFILLGLPTARDRRGRCSARPPHLRSLSGARQHPAPVQ